MSVQYRFAIIITNFYPAPVLSAASPNQVILSWFYVAMPAIVGKMTEWFSFLALQWSLVILRLISETPTNWKIVRQMKRDWYYGAFQDPLLAFLSSHISFQHLTSSKYCEINIWEEIALEKSEAETAIIEQVARQPSGVVETGWLLSNHLSYFTRYGQWVGRWKIMVNKQ